MRKSNQPTDRGRKHTLPLIFNWEKSRPWPCDVPHFVSLLSLLRFTTTPRSCSFTFLSWNLQAGGSSTARGCRIDWVGSRFLHLLLLLLGGRREKNGVGNTNAVAGTVWGSFGKHIWLEITLGSTLYWVLAVCKAPRYIRSTKTDHPRPMGAHWEMKTSDVACLQIVRI